jgi:hypothetical protein
MNKKEVIQDLEKRVKPYIGVEGWSQAKFSIYLNNAKNDCLKPKTLKAFFEAFGYFLVSDFDGKWEKWENI